MQQLIRPMSCTAAACIAAAALLAMPAHAQSHQVTRDGYVLRASTVRSTALPAETARAHGIERSAHLAVFNATVRKERSALADVAADVRATARNLAGMEWEIPLRRVQASNGLVSHTGTYAIASGEVLDFRVTAHPIGSPVELQLTFRDRMPEVAGTR